MSSVGGTQRRVAKPRLEESGPQGTMYIRPGDMPDLEGMVQPVEEDVLPTVTLIGIGAPFHQRRFPIRSTRTTIGGRKGEGNDIVLRDPTVSFVHARIIGRQGRWRVMNLLSTNGTFVNGKKVTDAAIRHGDRIRFGGVEFLFHDTFKARSTPRRKQWLWGTAVFVLLVAAGAVGAFGLLSM